MLISTNMSNTSTSFLENEKKINKNELMGEKPALQHRIL